MLQRQSVCPVRCRACSHTQFEPEIVLLDLGLPGMDGFQLAQELRKRAATANALLIAVTGYGQATDRSVRAMRASIIIW